MTGQSGTILLMAGGTGGHVFPALAVAHLLQERGHRVVWLGTPRGIENRVVPPHGFPLRHIHIGGLRGQRWQTLMWAPGRLLRALGQAIKIIRQEQPDVVLGMGGFASGPGGVAAWLLRKPLVIHEQNATLGTTNRWLARLAVVRLCGFAEVNGPQFKAQWVGNPVRAELLHVIGPEYRGTGLHVPQRLLVLGGSQGALALNKCLPQTLQLMPVGERPSVRHQAGEQHWKATQEAYQAAGITAHVVPFIEDMAEALGWADLVIARAGALTLAELTTVGVASILVPLPQAIDDHQTLNAQALVTAGAAQLIAQNQLTPIDLRSQIATCLQPERLQKMALAAKQLGQPQATRAVVTVLEQQLEAAHAA